MSKEEVCWRCQNTNGEHKPGCKPYDDIDQYRYREAAIHELRTELARVRGLLQRQWISVKERLPKYGETCLVVASGKTQYMAMRFDGKEFVWADGYDYGESAFDPFPSEQATAWMPLPEPSTFRESSELVPQGAESVEIGEVNSADENSCKFCGAAIEFTAEKVWRHVSHIHSDLCPKYGYPTEPSAETGGEKAGYRFDKDTVSMQDVALAESSLSCRHISTQGDRCCDCGKMMNRASPELLPTQLDKEGVCPRCLGTGWARPMEDACPRCHGSGKLIL